MADLDIRRFLSPPVETNAWLVVEPDSAAALLVDPGPGVAQAIAETCRSESLSLSAIVLTHGHIDHTGDAALLAETQGAPILAHADTAPMARDALLSGATWIGVEHRPYDISRTLAHGDTIELGSRLFTTIETPGHCPGSICLASDAICFTGDLLFKDGIGRCDLPGGDFETLRRSIQRLADQCPHAARLYPGHGETTTLDHELHHNPFL